MTKPFQTRAFVALMIGLSGLGLPITGIVNHYYGFAGFSVARHAWMSAHNFLGLVFVAFAIWHVVLNRRTMGNYLRNALAKAAGIRSEAVIASAVLATGLLLFVGHAFHAGH